MDVSGQAGELKQQGALEAARDPNSKVTAEDAEHTVIKEARKAGAPAFEFDPNASAEEKAAQANSVWTIVFGYLLQLKLMPLLLVYPTRPQNFPKPYSSWTGF
jgi:hypothetical protein